jgi:hypothetical protein
MSLSSTIVRKGRRVGRQRERDRVHRGRRQIPHQRCDQGYARNCSGTVIPSIDDRLMDGLAYICKRLVMNQSTWRACLYRSTPVTDPSVDFAAAPLRMVSDKGKPELAPRLPKKEKRVLPDRRRTRIAHSRRRKSFACSSFAIIDHNTVAPSPTDCKPLVHHLIHNGSTDRTQKGRHCRRRHTGKHPFERGSHLARRGSAQAVRRHRRGGRR